MDYTNYGLMYYTNYGFMDYTKYGYGLNELSIKFIFLSIRDSATFLELEKMMGEKDQLLVNEEIKYFWLF